MQGQLQQLQDAVAQMHKQLTDKDDDLEIKQYEAATKRLSALGNSDPQISMEQIQPLVMQIIGQMLQGGPPIAPQAAPQEQAQQAPEGAPQPDMGQQMLSPAPMPEQGPQPTQGMM